MAEIHGDDVRIDFNAEVPTNEWPPEGPRLLRCVKCDTQVAKTDGSPMLYWEFEDINDEGIVYRRVWTNTSLKPAALWRMRDLVNALGVFPGPDGFKRSEMLGKMLRGWIKHERYCDDHKNNSCGCTKARVIAKMDDYTPVA